MRRLLGVLVLVLLSGAGAAQWCSLPDTPPDVHALLDAVEGTVPELPELARTTEGQALLALLDEEAASGQVWPTLQSVYDLGSREAKGVEATSVAWTRSVAATMASTITSYAVLVRDGVNEEWLAMGVYTTSPLLERLRVVRLPDSARFAQRDTLLTLLATCYSRADTWIELPADSLTALVQDQHDGFMLASVRTHASTNEVRWVPLPEFLDAATFRHPATRDATAFSAWFTGATINPFDLAPLLANVTSNVEGRELFQALGELFR